MQLVVEISEDTFFDLKKKQNRTEVDNAVLNGTPLDKIRAEILEEKRKNTNMEYDKIFELCILIIEKYMDESEDTSYDLSDGIISEKEKQV